MPSASVDGKTLFQPFFFCRAYICESVQGEKQMKREQAEKITTEYLKPIYSLELKRCANLQDSEDLTQEIALKIFRALLHQTDIDRILQSG